MKIPQRVALMGILVGLLVLGVKLAAWLLSGSVALLSDALESLVNVSAAIVAAAAVSFALRPADSNHPYGHEKAELFAAVIEGVMILLAALAILYEAAAALLHPLPLRAAWRGLAVNGAASLLNYGWSLVLRRTAKTHRSAALQADAVHLLADVATSAAVIIGVALAVATGIRVLDAGVAALVALHVLWSGGKLVAASVDGLMDAAPSAAVLERIHALIAVHGGGAIEAHDLKTRATGRWTFLEFHLVVPGALSVAAAHDICDRIEQALMEEMADLVVTIHVEPASKAKHEGIAFAASGFNAPGQGRARAALVTAGAVIADRAQAWLARPQRRSRLLQSMLLVAVALHLMWFASLLMAPRLLGLLGGASRPAAAQPPLATIEMVMQNTKTAGGDRYLNHPDAEAGHPAAKPTRQTAPAARPRPQTADGPDGPSAATAAAQATPPAANPGGDPGTGLVSGLSVIPASPDDRHPNVPPAYPETAGLLGQQGTVQMLIHISAGGRPTAVEVTRSSGSIALDSAARSAALGWRFRAVRENGHQVPSLLPFAMQFSIDH